MAIGLALALAAYGDRARLTGRGRCRFTVHQLRMKSRLFICYRVTWCCQTRWDAFVYSVMQRSLDVWLSALCYGTTRVRSTCLSRTRSDSR